MRQGIALTEESPPGIPICFRATKSRSDHDTRMARCDCVDSRGWRLLGGTKTGDGKGHHKRDESYHFQHLGAGAVVWFSPEYVVIQQRCTDVSDVAEAPQLSQLSTADALISTPNPKQCRCLERTLRRNHLKKCAMWLDLSFEMHLVQVCAVRWQIEYKDVRNGTKVVP